MLCETIGNANIAEIPVHTRSPKSFHSLLYLFLFFSVCVSLSLSLSLRYLSLSVTLLSFSLRPSFSYCLSQVRAKWLGADDGIATPPPALTRTAPQKSWWQDRRPSSPKIFFNFAHSQNLFHGVAHVGFHACKLGECH